MKLLQVDLKDEHRTSNIERPTSNEKNNQYRNISVSSSFPIQHSPVSSFILIQNSMLDVRCWTFIFSPALKQFTTLRKSDHTIRNL